MFLFESSVLQAVKICQIYFAMVHVLSNISCRYPMQKYNLSDIFFVITVDPVVYEAQKVLITSRSNFLTFSCHSNIIYSCSVY